MKLELIVILSILTQLLSAYYLKQKDSIFILTDDNFEFVIRDYDYVLV